MKKLLILFVLLMALSYSLHEFGSYAQQESIPQISQHAQEPAAHYRIAILTPLTHPSLEQVQKGFKDTLKGSTFDVYNALGNQALMRTEIEEIAAKNYDLVFAVTTQATKMTKEVFEKKQLTVPIVFATVPHIMLSLLESKPTDVVHLTGSSEVTDYAKEIELITYLKKDVQTVLLVYDPTIAGLEQNRQEVESILKQKGIQLIAVEIFKTNEIRQKILPFITKTDVLLFLKDNTVVTGIDTLSKLCEAHQVLLCASDLDSVEKGAALGFGVHEYDYGTVAAQQAKQILDQHQAPKDVPIVPVDHFHLKINPANLKKQGLELDPHLLFLIQEGEAV